MKEFKTWLSQQDISVEARQTFEESFICFKADAYKAALLFGYLGMQHVIKDRILKSSPPSDIRQELWQSIQNKVRNYNTWDTAAYEALIRVTPAPFFPLSEDLKGQITFWKNRRNDCAHSKDNIISAGYVTSLYSFIQSNLPKMVVNGSRASLIQKIKNHYDPSKVRPGEDITYILNEIPHAITVDQMSSFFQEVTEYLGTLTDSNAFLGLVSSKYELLHKALSQSNEIVKQACSDSLIAAPDRLIQFLRQFPQDTEVLSNSPEIIRTLWHDNLFDSFNNDFSIIVSLLREQLIPENQKLELFATLLRKAGKHTPSELEVRTLRENNFFQYIRDQIIDDDINIMNDFDSSNRATALLTFFLAKNTITEEVAKKIYENFHYDLHPFDLKYSLISFFRSNPDKVSEYRSHLSDDIRVPNHITTLNIQEEAIEEEEEL